MSVVFIEPNPFASRLHVLASLVNGSQRAGMKAIVIMPRRSPGADMHEFRRSLPPGASPIVLTQLKPVKAHQKVRRAVVLLSVIKARSVSTKGTTVVLTSPDDYVSQLFWVLPLVRLTLRAVDLRIVRYRVADLSPNPSPSVKNLAKKLYFSVLTRTLRIRTIAFDERIKDKPSVDILPDPWSGPFGAYSKDEARLTLGIRRDSYVVGLIGRQDQRKGFPIAVAALTNDELDRTGMEVVIVGGVDRALQNYVDLLNSEYKADLHHFRNYVSDAELAEIFAVCDIILLPYHLNFTSSSGVLVRAAAAGTRVISSSHGLVGWRTRTYELGTTFAYPHETELVQALNAERGGRSVTKASRRYADGSTSDAVATSFAALLSRDRRSP